MKRRIMMVCCSALLAASLGMSGCGGGGIEEGIPQDTKPPDMSAVKTQMIPGKKQEPPPKVELPPTTGTEEKK
jgi:hypothetical protein